jgi:hypothetical protein
METDRIRDLSDREMAHIGGGSGVEDLFKRWDHSLQGEPQHVPFGGSDRNRFDSGARRLTG